MDEVGTSPEDLITYEPGRKPIPTVNMELLVQHVGDIKFCAGQAGVGALANGNEDELIVVQFSWFNETVEILNGDAFVPEDQEPILATDLVDAAARFEDQARVYANTLATVAHRGQIAVELKDAIRPLLEGYDAMAAHLRDAAAGLTDASEGSYGSEHSDDSDDSDYEL